jgi:uncharacterized protein YcbK (DUF882 family)
LPRAAQIIRDYYKKAVRITSSYRTSTHQKLLVARGLSAANHSQHEEGKAIDLQFIENGKQLHNQLVNDLVNQGEIWHLLRQAGITGIGVYDSFVHLDCRNSGFLKATTDHYGKYAFWDLRKKKAQAKPRNQKVMKN